MPIALKAVPGGDPAAVSPKVTRPAWAVLGLAALASVLEAVTPEMLDFLGDWKGAAYLLVGVVLQFVVGYKANDPARQGEAQEPALEAPAPADKITEPDAPLSVVG